MAILLPRKTAHRKVRKGKNEGVATRCNTVAFGDFGLMSLDNERINSRQIEAARRAITREMKRAGQIWIRIFPDVIHLFIHLIRILIGIKDQFTVISQNHNRVIQFKPQTEVSGNNRYKSFPFQSFHHHLKGPGR